MANLLFPVTTNDVLKAQSLRIDISTLSPAGIELACQEAQEPINHNLDTQIR